MCLMLCNVDSTSPLSISFFILHPPWKFGLLTQHLMIVLFCALILHWVTIVENTYKLPSRYDPEDERSVFHYNYHDNNNHHNHNRHSSHNYNMGDVRTASTQSEISDITFPGRVLGHVNDRASVAAATATTATATATGDGITPRRPESAVVYTASSGGGSGDVDVGAGGLQLEIMAGRYGKVRKGEDAGDSGTCGEIYQDDRASEGGGNGMDVVNSSTERIVGSGSGER